MSRRTFAITFGFIFAMGLLGMWLGYTATDSGDFRRWGGMALLLAAAAALAIVFRRDLRFSPREAQIEWQRVRTRGRRRYLIVELLRSQLVLLPVLYIGAFELYKNRTWASVTRPQRWWIVAAAISAIFSLAEAIRWWRRQERRYSNGPSQ
jgi:hypothetical protein